MFVTLDVVFHEDSMYFSSEHELLGEYQEKVQILDYDDHISEEGELFNQDAGNLDTSGIDLDASGDEHVETELVAPPLSEYLAPQVTDTPNQSFAEDVLPLMSKPSRK